MTNRIKVGIINPQGHVRFNDLQISHHPDTGGQIVYVIELAKALVKQGCHVDIFTRYFADSAWPGYDKEQEIYNEHLRIIRVKCGPREQYVSKENLWPFVTEFTEGIMNFYDEQGYEPDIFSSHYADSGMVGSLLKKAMKKPFIHTGHSLGGVKMDNLEITADNFDHINSRFKFHLRINSERVCFRNSSAIIVSTQEEIDKQYAHRVYKNTIKDMAKFNIIPPGISPESFFSYYNEEPDPDAYNNVADKIRTELSSKISRSRRELPCILSASRFAEKKNPIGLLKAYAGSELLQQNANLLIVAGKLDDPLASENFQYFNDREKSIIKEMLDIIEEFDLGGKICVIRGLNYKTEMPYMYRYAARNNWIFINPALHEPFGLTIVEAMASGLPVVATRHGGPADILDNEKYGVLIEPTDWHSIRGGLIKLLYARFWGKYAQLGVERVKEKYTWAHMASGYIKVFEKVLSEKLSLKGDFEIPEYFRDPGIKIEKKMLERLKTLYRII